MCVELTNGNERTSDGLRLGNEGEQRATVGMGMGVHGVWLVGTDIYQHQQQQRNHVDADGLDRERNVREKKVNTVLGMRQKIGQGREGMRGAGGGSSFRNNGHPVRRLCYFNENWKVLPLLLLLLLLSPPLPPPAAVHFHCPQNHLDHVSCHAH